MTDFKNAVDLLYGIVTVPDPTFEEEDECSFDFIDETCGSILKSVSLSTWVRSHDLYYITTYKYGIGKP